MGDEAVGQPFRDGIERAQERVQVLLRAAHRLRLAAGVGVRPVQRAHVGVDLEQPVLALGVRRRGDQLVDDAPHVGGGDVVAEHEPGEALQAVGGGLGVGEAHALARGRRRGVVERLDLQQRAARR